MTGMTLDEASNHMTSTNPVFALDQATVDGVTYPVFKNAPDHMRHMLQVARQYHGNGDDEFLVYQQQRWSYDAFCADSNRLAHGLIQHFNIGKGDPIGLAMRNYPEMLIAMMAISSIGAVVVFLNGWWTTSELDYALQDSEARIVFADEERLQRLAPLIESRELQLISVRSENFANLVGFGELMAKGHSSEWPETVIDTDDDFAIMYSSGTTGHPKGVVQTHRGAISAVYCWWMTLLLGPLMADESAKRAESSSPAVLIVTPLFHVTATHPMFLLSIPLGAKVVLMYKWDAQEAIRLINQEQITRFLGVPTQSADLMEEVKRQGVELPSLEFLSSGGAKRPPAQVAQLQQTFPQVAVASGWGMTETNAIGIGISGPDYLARPGAAGRLYPPLHRLQIIDDDGREVTNGVVGELSVKSAANMRCYLNKPEETAEILQDGWLRTGDLAWVDDEGYVTIVDRKKNIIIRGGENIACLEVEAALHRHPAVVEAGVFSVPDERLGEVVGAGIQLRDGHRVEADELRGFLGQHLAQFKIPDYFWFRHDELPRGATDKTDRRALRTQCLGSS